MSTKKHEPITLDITPTIFPELNKKLQQDPQHETTVITVARMKHKHIRLMQDMSEAKQIQFIMAELTGLNEIDLDELDAEDSAALSEIIFGFMRKYAELAKEFMA